MTTVAPFFNSTSSPNLIYYRSAPIDPNTHKPQTKVDAYQGTLQVTGTSLGNTNRNRRNSENKEDRESKPNQKHKPKTKKINRRSSPTTPRYRRRGNRSKNKESESFHQRLKELRSHQAMLHWHFQSSSPSSPSRNTHARTRNSNNNNNNNKNTQSSSPSSSGPQLDPYATLDWEGAGTVSDTREYPLLDRDVYRRAVMPWGGEAVVSEGEREGKGMSWLYGGEDDNNTDNNNNNNGGDDNNIPATHPVHINQEQSRSPHIPQHNLRRPHSAGHYPRNRRPSGPTIPQPFSFEFRDTHRNKTSRPSSSPSSSPGHSHSDPSITPSRPFTATPVPPSTFIPKYTRMQAEAHHRRQQRRSQAQDRIRSSMRPFSFGDGHRQRHRSTSADPHHPHHHHHHHPHHHQPFRAHPVPASTYRRPKEQEREKDRTARIARRSLDLLSRASMPPRMAAWGEQHGTRTPSSSSPSFPFQPHTNRSVPDFSSLHAAFRRRLDTARQQHPPTRPRSFSLHPGRGEEQERQRVLSEMADDEYRLREMRWPYVSTRYPHPDDGDHHHDHHDDDHGSGTGIHGYPSSRSRRPVSAPDTRSSRLRQEHCRREMAEAAQREEERREAERRRRRRQREVTERVAPQVQSRTMELATKRRHRPGDVRKALQKREAEYERGMKAMLDRVENREAVFLR